jgi:hypothetical protein
LLNTKDGVATLGQIKEGVQSLQMADGRMVREKKREL